MNDQYPHLDYETTIRCDVCGAEFPCKRSDITTKFLAGSYCSHRCYFKLQDAIRSLYRHEH